MNTNFPSSERVFIKKKHFQAFSKNHRLFRIETSKEISVQDILRTGITTCAYSADPWCVGDTILELTLKTPRLFRFLRISSKDRIVVEALDTLKQRFIERADFRRHKKKMIRELGITELEYQVIDKNLSMA